MRHQLLLEVIQIQYPCTTNQHIIHSYLQQKTQHQTIYPTGQGAQA